MDKKMQTELQKIRQELLQQIENSNETPQAKAALKTMFGNMTDEEFMQIAYPGYRDNKHETVGEVPIEFAHPFTKRSPIKMEKGTDIAIEHIDAATIHVVRKVYPGSYFNVYFIRDARDSFKAVCYYGDILNEHQTFFKSYLLEIFSKSMFQIYTKVEELKFRNFRRGKAFVLNMSLDCQDQSRMLMLTRKQLNRPRTYLGPIFATRN